MKTILISGGSDGLGKAIAEKFSQKYNVVILGKDSQKTSQVAKGIGCDYIVADVSNYNDVEKAVSTIIERHKRIEYLINCAALWIQGKLEENGAEDIKKVIEVNTIGTIYLSKATLPLMKQQKQGRIINVISQGGLYGKAERSVYTASKFALTGFTKSMSQELAGTGVTMDGFYPGPFKSNFFLKSGIEKDMSKHMELSEVVRALEFIVETPNNIEIPELGIKRI